MAFDPTKPVRTRDGRPARILCTDLSAPKPIAAAIVEPSGIESVWLFQHDGYYYAYLGGQERSPNDLINIPERHVRYMPVYGQLVGYASLEEALEHHQGTDVFAIVRLEFEEGEGL